MFGIGIDRSPEVGVAGRRLFREHQPGSRVAFVRATAEDLPLATSSVDVIVCRLVLPYTDNARALAEIARVLSPGGVLLLKFQHARFYFRELATGLTQRQFKSVVHACRVLVAGAIYHLTGSQPRRWITGESFQTMWLLRRELARNGLEIQRILTRLSSCNPDSADRASGYEPLRHGAARAGRGSSIAAWRTGEHPWKLSDRSWRAFVGWFVLFAAVGLLVAYLNRHHIEQQSNYTIYVAMANYYRGLQHLEVLTYPTWGYPFVLILIRRYDLVAIPQVLLASVAMTALFLRLRAELPANRRALAVLFLLALPWYLLHSVEVATFVRRIIPVLGLVVLERALRTHSLRAGCGRRSVLRGGPVFQIRVSVPSSVPVDGRSAEPGGPEVCRRCPCRRWLRARRLAWINLIPWGLHYREQTGHFSLTASQAWHCCVHFPRTTAAQPMGGCVRRRVCLCIPRPSRSPASA